LGLYDENDKLQEMMVSLQYKIQQQSQSDKSGIDLDDLKLDFLKKGKENKDQMQERKELEQ